MSQWELIGSPSSGIVGRVQTKPRNGAIASGLVAAVILWGGNNTGVKVLVKQWPALTTGSTRFIAAGLLMLAVFRWTNWLGRQVPMSAETKRILWTRCALSFAVYIAVFNWALQLTELSHVAVYLAAAPVWALLWEGWPERSWKSAQRYGAAALAFSGVLALFLPSLLHAKSGGIFGEILGLACSVLWTNFGEQCRAVGSDIPGPQVTAQTFWRAGILLAPLSFVELATGSTMPLPASLLGIPLFCAIFGGGVAFALWNHGLRHWKTSQVYLFSNLIPLSNMAWAHACLREQITTRFWISTLLIISGGLLSQANWQRIFGMRWLPTD